MSTFRTILLAILLLVPPMATAVGSRVLRYPKRFAEVIPGQLYRGGFPSAEHIRNLDTDKNIKTIIALTNDEDRPQDRAEKRAAKKASILIRRFPMPGDGCGRFGDLDRAADALAGALAFKKSRPVYLHCAAGKQRSNAVLAAYRMRACRWSLDQALAELEDNYDLDREAESALVDHLVRYAGWLAGSERQPDTETRESIEAECPSP